MNQAASFQHDVIPLRPGKRGPALGWGISLLVHALAAGWIWHAWPSSPPDTDSGPIQQIEVRLIPPAREAPPAKPASDAGSSISHAPATTSARVTRNPPRAGQAQTPPTTTPDATPPTAEAAANPAAPIASPEAPAASALGPVTDNPAVDLAAARAAARLIARENPKGLVALPERKPVVDPNENHHVVDPIEQARRVDCQTARAQSTNLLANVVMLAVDLTKNAIDDSGCKWR